MENIKDLRILEYKGERVLIVKQLSELTGIYKTYINSFFNNYKYCFKENKHYFKLSDKELIEFKKEPNVEEVIGRHKILWTKEGVLQYSKITTNKDRTKKLYEVYKTLKNMERDKNEKIYTAEEMKIIKNCWEVLIEYKAKSVANSRNIGVLYGLSHECILKDIQKIIEKTSSTDARFTKRPYGDIDMNIQGFYLLVNEIGLPESVPNREQKEQTINNNSGNKINNDLTVIEQGGLIKIYETDKGEKVVNGREMWEYLGVQKKFTDWIKNNLNAIDAIENVDFTSFPFKVKAQNTYLNTIEYILKLDTSKEIAMIAGVMPRANKELKEKSKKYRKYLIEIEKKYKQEILNQNSVPQLNSKTLYQLAQQCKKREEELNIREEKIKENETYIAIGKMVTGSKDIMTLSNYVNSLCVSSLTN